MHIFVVNNHAMGNLTKRNHEQSMSIEYFSGLNDSYDKWINEYDSKHYGLFPLEKKPCPVADIVSQSPSLHSVAEIVKH